MNGSIKTEAKVGLFVLIGIILLFYMTFKISGHGKRSGSGEIYFAKFNDVSGLIEKSKVEISGVNAGWVDKINLTPDGKALVKIVLKKNVVLKKDAAAFIKTYGFMGEKYIQIYPGKSGSRLTPESYIENTFSEKSIGDVANNISDAANEFKKFIKNFNDTLIKGGGKNKIKNILSNFEKFSKDLSMLMENNKTELQDIIDNLNYFSNNLAKSSSKFQSIFSKVDKTFTNFDKITNRLSKGEGTIGKLLKNDELYNNLNNTFANLDKITEKINKGEGTLGKLINDKDFYSDLKGTFKGLKELTEKISSGNGTLGKLVNDDTIYKNLKLTVSNLKDITEKIDKGKGTLGKIITDDSMYKEIDKTLLRIQQAASGFSEQTPISTFGVVMGTLFSF